MDATDNRERWGLIIVGGGVTGLSTGITWALHRDVERHPVLIVEKQKKTGGYVTSYARRGFLFDTCQVIPNVSDLLSFLGVDIELREFTGDYVRLILVDPRTHARRIIALPSGFDAFKAYLADRYPDQAPAIRRFLDHSRAMYRELFRLKMEPRLHEIIGMLATCPKIVRNGHKTYREYYRQFDIDHPELAEIFDVFAAFSGLPSRSVSALVPVSAMNSLLDGAFRPKEGFIAFPKQLEARYRSLGGALRLGASVTDILTDGGRVLGVRLDSGERLIADAVVTTIDPKTALLEMVGPEPLSAIDPGYARKAAEARMSVSSMNIALGLDEAIDLRALGLDCGYNVITTGGGTFDELFRLSERGENGFSDERFHLGVICPSLTTGGKPSLTIRVVPMTMGRWDELWRTDREAYKREKNRLADFFIEKVERYLVPELREHIVVRDVATPATYARYSGVPSGAIYDMAPYPDNFGRARLKMRTPIKGLFQPKFVHGVLGALLAGLQVNDLMLDRRVMNGNARLSPGCR